MIKPQTGALLIRIVDLSVWRNMTQKAIAAELGMTAQAVNYHIVKNRDLFEALKRETLKGAAWELGRKRSPTVSTETQERILNDSSLAAKLKEETLRGTAFELGRQRYTQIYEGAALCTDRVHDKLK